MLGGYWGARKGGVEEAEGGWLANDNGGQMAERNCRRMMGGVPRPRTSMGNGMVRERKGERGRELTTGNSNPQDLKTVSWNNGNDGNIVRHVPVMGSAVGVVPISPTVEFREVSAGAGWERQSSTMTPPLGLPLRRWGLPVFIFVSGAKRPRSCRWVQRLRPSLKNRGTSRSRHLRRRLRRFRW